MRGGDQRDQGEQGKGRENHEIPSGSCCPRSLWSKQHLSDLGGRNELVKSACFQRRLGGKLCLGPLEFRYGEEVLCAVAACLLTGRKRGRLRPVSVQRRV
jgi:hypothetical protein